MCREEKVTPSQRFEELVHDSGHKPFTAESFRAMQEGLRSDPLIRAYCEFHRDVVERRREDVS